jgi:hypothetical protein
LFDFDDDLDDLSEVSERYNCQMFSLQKEEQPQQGEAPKIEEVKAEKKAKRLKSAVPQQPNKKKNLEMQRGRI